MILTIHKDLVHKDIINIVKTVQLSRVGRETQNHVLKKAVEREGAIETERQRDRETERQRDRETQRQSGQRRERGNERKKHKYKDKEEEKDRQTEARDIPGRLAGSTSFCCLSFMSAYVPKLKSLPKRRSTAPLYVGSWNALEASKEQDGAQARQLPGNMALLRIFFVNQL